MTKPTCGVPDCEVESYCRGYCRKHYKRLWRHGDPEFMAQPLFRGSSLAEQFHHYAPDLPAAGCAEWRGRRTPQGYGVVYFGDRPHGAHRVSHEIHTGPIPEGLMIRHKCDNPPCVNPDHLETGTSEDNVRDAVERGRAARGTGIASSKLDEEKVHRIRSLSGVVKQRDIAASLGVSQSAISAVITGRTWAHVQRKEN